MRTALLLTTAVAVLGLAPAASADHPQDDRRYAQEYGGRYDQGYDRRDDPRDDRAYDWRRDPRSTQMEQVREMAHELELATARVHRGTEARNRRPDRREEAVFVRLHRLEDSARRFHRVVESRGQSFWSTQDDFHGLVNDYLAAWRAQRDLAGHRRLHEDFTQIDRLINRLTKYYGTPNSGAGWSGSQDHRYGGNARRH